jgi:hypothetical protein
MATFADICALQSLACRSIVKMNTARLIFVRTCCTSEVPTVSPVRWMLRGHLAVEALLCGLRSVPHARLKILEAAIVRRVGLTLPPGFERISLSFAQAPQVQHNALYASSEKLEVAELNISLWGRCQVDCLRWRRSQRPLWFKLLAEFLL